MPPTARSRAVRSPTSVPFRGISVRGYTSLRSIVRLVISLFVLFILVGLLVAFVGHVAWSLYPDRIHQCFCSCQFPSYASTGPDYTCRNMPCERYTVTTYNPAFSPHIIASFGRITGGIPKDRVERFNKHTGAQSLKIYKSHRFDLRPNGFLYLIGKSQRQRLLQHR